MNGFELRSLELPGVQDSDLVPQKLCQDSAPNLSQNTAARVCTDLVLQEPCQDSSNPR